MSKEKVRMTPDRITDKWGRHMKSAVSDINAGIDTMTVDPGQAAVAKQQKMRDNLNEAIDNGIWAKRRLEVSKSDWQKITKEKVSKNMATGVEQALPKRKRFDNWLVQRLNGILPEISAMPDMTKEDSKQRMNRQFDYMAGEKYKSV